MTKRFVFQLMPFGLIAGLFFASGTKAGMTGELVWIYSCNFSVGASVGSRIDPGRADPAWVPRGLSSTLLNHYWWRTDWRTIEPTAAKRCRS